MSMDLNRVARWNWDDVRIDVGLDDKGKKDFTIPVNRIAMQGNRIVTPEFSANMTDWAETQLFSKLGMPGHYFKKMLNVNPELVQDHANYHLNRITLDNPDTKWLLRTRMGESDNNLIRAFLSDKYTIFDNKHLVEILTDILHKHTQEYKIVLWNLTDGSFNLRVTFPKLTKSIGTTIDGKDDVHVVGVHFSNSEIGKHTVDITGMVWRLVCTNGLMGWSKEEVFSQRHIYLDHDEMYGRIVKATGKAIKAGADMIDSIIKAKTKKIEDPFDIIDKLAIDGNFSQKFTDTVKTNYQIEPDMNVYGIVNALTRSAQEIGDADKQVEIERFANKTMQKLLAG